MKINNSHLKILGFIYTSPTHHVGVAEINTCLPHLTQKSVAKLIKQLVNEDYISFHMKDPMKGASSQYLYHLKLKGAKEIGIEKLATVFYTQPNKEFADYKGIADFIKSQAKKSGLLVVDEEQACQATLTNYIAKLTGHYQKHVSVIDPDFLLIAKNAVCLIIVLHPSAGRTKFVQKVKQYEAIRSWIQLWFVVMSEAHVQLFKESVSSLGIAETQIKFFLPKDFEG